MMELECPTVKLDEFRAGDVRFEETKEAPHFFCSRSQSKSACNGLNGAPPPEFIRGNSNPQCDCFGNRAFRR